MAGKKLNGRGDEVSARRAQLRARFKTEFYTKCAFGRVSGHYVQAPAAPKARVSHKDPREPKRALQVVHWRNGQRQTLTTPLECSESNKGNTTGLLTLHRLHQGKLTAAKAGCG